jgi:uncharacterized protein
LKARPSPLPPATAFALLLPPSPAMPRHAARRSLRLALLAAGLGLVLAGCNIIPKPTPDPTRHFVLTGPTPAELNIGVKQGTLKVGLRSIQVAPYLDGKSMIVRRGNHEIDYLDFARWAEPLATGINRMLVARLHASEHVARVFPQPFPFDTERDLDISIQVLRCEGRVLPDGSAFASFLCSIEIAQVGDRPAHGETPGGRVLVREVFEADPIPWREGDYAALAAALSTQVAQLAEHIIQRLPATPEPARPAR